MSVNDLFAEAHWPPEASKTVSGANAPRISQRAFRKKDVQKPSCSAGTLRCNITHREMKMVEEQFQRISIVPR